MNSDRHALVVDDSDALRDVVCEILVRSGFQPRAAAHGGEAMDDLERHGMPALLVVDWQMPVMDGLELVRSMRRMPGGPGVRVMMVSAVSGLDDLREALGAGVDEYLMKPYTHEALTDKLALLGFTPAPQTPFTR